MVSESGLFAHALRRLDDYSGQAEVAIAPTQLDGMTAKARTSILNEWIDFFGAGPSAITVLSIHSRVPQDLLDSLEVQTQLTSLSLKWGPYSDLRPLARLRSLSALSLRGATSVVDLTPLEGLQQLLTLTLDQIHGVTDLAPIGKLAGLNSLSVGNGYPGSDKTLVIRDLDWLRPLNQLVTLALPGTNLQKQLLDVIVELPRLDELFLPPRRSYRARVFELAETSDAFAHVAQTYGEFDELRATWKAQAETARD